MNSLNDIAARTILSLEQLVRIEEYILNSGNMTPEKTRREMEWFLIDLGIDAYYFQTTAETEIARHLIALAASKCIALQGGGEAGVQLIDEREEQAVYIIDDAPQKALEIEKRIERKYPGFHLESYPTKETPGSPPFRFYIMTKPAFAPRTDEGSLTFDQAADGAFFTRAVPETVVRYREAWQSMHAKETPHIAISEKHETEETRIMIGVKGGKHQQVLSILSNLALNFGLTITRKYVEPFSDDKKIASLYFPRLTEKAIDNLTHGITISLMLPEGAVKELFEKGAMSPQAAMYAISAAAFTHQFISLLAEEYKTLQRALKDQPEARGIVDNLKMSLLKDTYSTARIATTIAKHLQVVELLYNHFALRFQEKKEELCAKEEQRIRAVLEREVDYGKDRAILHYFLLFNNSIQKTNFYKKENSCMAYRLSPDIVNPVDFPERIFGLFLLVGRDFLGFHIRFRDIARGGLRIVKSRSLDMYAHNIDTIFTENYNLALTQQRKNKDIPEGGAKGAILLNMNSQAFAEQAFRDYIDGLLDLMLEKDAEGNMQAREILFIGPDEGSAGFMNWAALHAKSRSCPFWSAFSTGKDPELGGIPHDLFGMTTIGVHEYVLGVLGKHGLKEEEITKIQTGGPDGDLGSNEILISRDKTLAVIDGSGVLYDPSGLDRNELVRLARKRIMAEQFDRTKLSPEGFFVSVADRDITLPNGEIIKNGEDFRNVFHLGKYARADLFVPCGGRPGAINITNWQSLLDDRGQPKFRFIVEGANLFITEEARLRLEEKGIVVLKDASTNKGGVTSSSFEVFASLGLSSERYNELMCIQGSAVPEFRQHYIAWIMETIKAYARAEFELLWQEREATGQTFTALSNIVSEKINRIADSIRESTLAGDPAIQKQMMLEYAPPRLVKMVGIDAVLQTIPDAYIKAVTAVKMATEFVYGRGLRANEVDFAAYVEEIRKRCQR